MPRLKHEVVLSDFNHYVHESRNLVSAARQWIIPANGPKRPRFTISHRNVLIELAFLRSFLAWERFLEETFILYLLGKKPTKKRFAPKCYVVPNTWDHAFQLLLPEGGHRKYVDWDNSQFVRLRAKRFFADGEPFESALTARLNLLEEMRVVRNAIAHRSLHSQNIFRGLVRDKLTYLPPNISVGAFLESSIAGAHPPQTYLDRYFDGISKAATAIVP